MKYIIVAILLVNNEPRRVEFPEHYDTQAECNYQAMRKVFQMHTAAQWSITCVRAQ